VGPDWVLDCVEAMSHLDEARYHPRLLLTASQLAVHQASAKTSVHSTSDDNSWLGVTEPPRCTVLSPPVRSYAITAAAKSTVATVPVYVSRTTATPQPAAATPQPLTAVPQPPTATPQLPMRTHLKNIGNATEYLSEVSQSALKPFSSSKVCVGVCAQLLTSYVVM